MNPQIFIAAFFMIGISNRLDLKGYKIPTIIFLTCGNICSFQEFVTLPIFFITIIYLNMDKLSILFKPKQFLTKLIFN
jgi:hypothetical protein